MLLFILQTVLPEWERWVGQGVAVTLVIVFLGFLLRALPTWKEVKIEEFKIRQKEAEASGQVAGSLTLLANAQIQQSAALGQLGETIKDIAIEQKKATDNVLILQRVNANEAQNIAQAVDTLNERLDTLEDNFKEQGFYATRPKAVKKTGN